MLQVARLAPRLLGESSDLVRDFVLRELDDDGGFRGRDGKPDLYYTVFGIACLEALQADVPGERIRAYLERFRGDAVTDLDLVHLACLARCRAATPGAAFDGGERDAVLECLAAFRSRDGGFHNRPGSESGTVYGCFLALGAFQDLEVEFPDLERACAFVGSMRSGDGGFANERSLPLGSTPATTAAVAFLRNAGREVSPEVTDWLAARFHPQGGFVAAPGVLLPDLLSTATALHALDGLGYPIERIREPCLEFVDTLWTSQGSFYGNWGETELDCEYTFYGLLAIGHLSL